MLGDDLRAVLPELKRHAESRMGSTDHGSDATVYRLTGRTIPGPDGLDEPERVIVHAGPMRLRSGRGGAGPTRTKSVPGGEVSLATREAHFPAATPTFRDGDLIHIDAGRSAGAWWLVIEADRADQQTAYRVPVVAAEQP